MKAITEEIHEQMVEALDQMITAAYEAKEQYLRKEYEDVVVSLDKVSVARKKAEAFNNEMWE